MLDLPELLLDVATAADAARKRHSLEDVLVAAGMPRTHRPSRDDVLAQLVVRWKLTHPDDVRAARETVDEILSLAGY